MALAQRTVVHPAFPSNLLIPPRSVPVPYRRLPSLFRLRPSSAHLCNTDDHVLDQRLDGPQACNVLSGTVPDCELDLVVLGGLDLIVVS